MYTASAISNCTACTFTHNQFDASSQPYGTNNLIGSPNFVGGTQGWGAYRLTSSSVGYRAATDGFDMGIN